MVGRRDAGACSPSCIFRLEAAAAAQDCQRKIEGAMKILQKRYTTQGAWSFYQGQIITNLAPFEKTIDAFVSDDRLRIALKSCDKGYFEPLPSPTKNKLISYLEDK